ncbi:HpcH/HpaI aldolase/citrate lyase family protein [Xanthobacter sp. TB0139]|uniref:HpcH/HpaI aldolase/citrate lyase family protein n=1 Tax=Xanthobacter sp. TB0139 TaxID=3459178 RepID=UPI0040398BEC
MALFVPGTRPERFGKALATGADVVIIDLEDAVALAEKESAREAISAAFPAAGRILLRINGHGTRWHEEDVRLAARLPLAGVMLPKAESAAGMARLNDALGGRMPLVALIESALGLAHAREIASAPGVVRLGFGSIDFAADLGCAHTRDALLLARSELVLAARLAGLAGPIDGVTADVGKMDLARSDTLHAVELGFAGKLCIHPRQVETVQAAFAPSEEEIAWARRIVSSLEAGGAVVQVDGAMVDAPVRLRAERILARADGSGGEALSQM